MNKRMVLVVSASLVISGVNAANNQNNNNEHLRRPTTWQQIVNRFVGPEGENQPVQQPAPATAHVAPQPGDLGTLAALINTALNNPNPTLFVAGRGHGDMQPFGGTDPQNFEHFTNTGELPSRRGRGRSGA